MKIVCTEPTNGLVFDVVDYKIIQPQYPYGSHYINIPVVAHNDPMHVFIGTQINTMRDKEIKRLEDKVSELQRELSASRIRVDNAIEVLEGGNE